MTNVNGASIRISTGSITVEYTGEQSFIEGGGLLELIKGLTKVEFPSPPLLPAPSFLPSDASSAQINHLSTNTIASLMGVQSGPDLIIAALAHLQLVKGKDKASRTDISNEMKSATTYFKSTFTGNLTSYFNSLVKAKRLNQVAENMYALSANERQNLEVILAAN